MKGFIIVLESYTPALPNALRFKAECKEIDCEIVQAITPETMGSLAAANEYSYERLPIGDHPGRGVAPKPQSACGLSHAACWERCVELNEPIAVFEHDVRYDGAINLNLLLSTDHLFVSMNKAYRFEWHRQAEMFQSGEILTVKKATEILTDPTGINPQILEVDQRAIRDNAPQSLPGMSAYIVKPAGAKKALEALQTYGMWINDQLINTYTFPDQLGFLRNGVTTINWNMDSTTYGYSHNSN